MTEIENTLYILENLSSTESKDLEHVEIDVYYEDDQGNEGAAQYDMPTIADKAIEAIVELRNEKAEIEKERDKYKAHFDKEIERHYPKKKFPRQRKELKAGE